MLNHNCKVISACNLSFQYRKQNIRALNSFDFDLYEDEIVCVLGHNGAGKTTLLNLIYGTLRPCCGRVVINQKIIHTYKDIFYLDSEFRLNDNMTVLENLEFRMSLLGKNASNDSSSLLERFSLLHYKDIPLKSFSSGLRQRANLTIGFSINPSLLLLDEPTNTVDPETRFILEDVLRNLERPSSSALIVTHDLDFAYSIANRCIVIQDGKKIAQCVPAEYGNSQDFQNEYLFITREREAGR